MKTIFLFLILLCPVFASSQCNPVEFGTLKAEVHGDTVILKNDTVFRNCGSDYSMEISYLSNDTLVWLENDIGGVAYCFCHYNLSVTIDSLSSGDYIAKVYFYDPEHWVTCFIGFIHFSISQPVAYTTPSVRNQVQSNCFTVVPSGISGDLSPYSEHLKIFPNPAGDIITLRSNVDGPRKILFFDMESRTILELVSDRKEEVLNLSGFSKGMYFVTVQSGDQTLHSKFYKR